MRECLKEDTTVSFHYCPLPYHESQYCLHHTCNFVRGKEGSEAPILFLPKNSSFFSGTEMKREK